MREYIISTDSNSDIPTSYIAHNHITIIPQYYSFDDVVYGDELNLTPEDFYQKMQDGELPTSMANNPAVIKEKFESLILQGKDILHIAFSSALSGSYNNVAVVATELMEEYPEAKIIVIDSLTVSLAETILILEAIKKKNAGATIVETAEYIETIKSNIVVEFTVDDVNHLYRGGRIKKTTSVVLGLANIKPLLRLDDQGALASSGIIRGRKKSLSTLANNMLERLTGSITCNIAGIVHGNCLDDAKYLEGLIKMKQPDIQIIINDISPSIGTHAGPGAIGLLYLLEK